MNLHPASVLTLAFISLSCFHEMSYGLSAKFIPEYKRAESNYKWFKIDKQAKPIDASLEELSGSSGYNTKLQELQQAQQAGLLDSENIPLPLALRMLHEKRGFDLGTGRGYSGFQAMRGNLGLQFASPGSHGK